MRKLQGLSYPSTLDQIDDVEDEVIGGKAIKKEQSRGKERQQMLIESTQLHDF